jgi:hypothetical protein
MRRYVIALSVAGLDDILSSAAPPDEPEAPTEGLDVPQPGSSAACEREIPVAGEARHREPAATRAGQNIILPKKNSVWSVRNAGSGGIPRPHYRIPLTSPLVHRTGPGARPSRTRRGWASGRAQIVTSIVAPRPPDPAPGHPVMCRGSGSVAAVSATCHGSAPRRGRKSPQNGH